MPDRLLSFSLALLFVADIVLAQSTDASPQTLCVAHADAVLDALASAHYDDATHEFDDALRSRYPSAKLRQDYEALPSQYGKMLGDGRPHVGDVAGHTVVMTPLIFERGTLTVETHCDGEGRIADFRLLPTQAMSAP